MSPSPNPSKKHSKAELLQDAEALLTGRWITDLANVSALVMANFEDINWVGFYLVPEDRKDVLWLGPFQGLPACTEIPFSKGVCGSAARQKQSQRIDDVNSFPGHIVCDSRSRSEVVVPMVKNNEVIGVFDVDSTSLARFSEEDLKFFENLIAVIMKKYL